MRGGSREIENGQGSREGNWEDRLRGLKCEHRWFSSSLFAEKMDMLMFEIKGRNTQRKSAKKFYSDEEEVESTAYSGYTFKCSSVGCKRKS